MIITKANEVISVVTTIWNYAIDENVIQKKKKSESEMVLLKKKPLHITTG
jgi:hypothetical protein